MEYVLHVCLKIKTLIVNASTQSLNKVNNMDYGLNHVFLIRSFRHPIYGFRRVSLHSLLEPDPLVPS